MPPPRAFGPVGMASAALIVIAAAAHPALVAAAEAFIDKQARHDETAIHIAAAAQRFGLPRAWIAAVLRAESAGDPRATSRAGAMGLMQIMPRTWADLRARHRLGHDPYDPRDSVLAGAAYLRELFDRYGAPGFLAAYNAGPGRYEESLATGRPLPAETRAYLARLAPIVGSSRADGAVSEPSPSVTWRHSSLFPSRSEVISPAADDVYSLHADRPTSAGFSASFPIPGPDGAGLFVRLSSLPSGR